MPYLLTYLGHGLTYQTTILPRYQFVIVSFILNLEPMLSPWGAILIPSNSILYLILQVLYRLIFII